MANETWDLRAEDFETEAQLPAEETFLTEVQRATQLVDLCLVPELVKRMVSVFLETDRYDNARQVVTPVKSWLLMECLPAFVEANGGRIVAAKKLADYHEVTDAVYRTIHVAGTARQVLQDGYLFLCFENERVVVSVETGQGSQVLHTVYSNQGSAAFEQRWLAYCRQHNYLRGRSFFADGTIIERKKAYTWDDILLPEKTKTLIRTHVEDFLKFRGQLKKAGVKSRRGLILSGPPGTGKTLLGKILADLLNVSFLWVSPRHIGTVASFADILSLARFVAPAVVFLEDLDLFAEDRNRGSWSGLGELMNQLDGAIDNEDVVTIATTNRLEVVEQALRNRPGRFDRVVQFDAMDADCRRGLLSRLLAKARIAPNDFDRLIAVTADYTGAQVEELANTLYLMAMREDSASEDPFADGIRITRKLLDAAIEDTRQDPANKFGFIAGRS